MLVTFRCAPELKERADSLVRAGLYADFSTFCCTAIENQLLLEQDQAPSQMRTRGRDQAARPGKGVSRARKGKPADDWSMRGNREATPDQPGAESLGLVQPLANDNAPLAAVAIGASVSTLFDLRNLPVRSPFPLPDTYGDVFGADQAVPVERWLFGQYNRLLPAKVSARALAMIASEGKEAALLELAAPRIAEAASAFGEYLRSVDRRFGSHRDDALSIAFPAGGTEGEKGRLRYQSHFVGHVVKGEQGGLLVGLKLAAIQVHKNKPHILPTHAGWEFARLPNPLLDEPISEMPPRLGTQDIAFLLRHIEEHVPTEIFAYRTMLSLIAEGLNTPESVNQGLARHIEPGKSLEDEADFISTQRGGVLGRMGDLGLVSRGRHGTRITYHITPAGQDLLMHIGEREPAQR